MSEQNPRNGKVRSEGEPELLDKSGDGQAAESQDTVEELQASKGGAAADEVVELSLEEQLVKAEQQAAEYLDGWQRARAEFANARKRLERERTEAYRTAAIEFAKKLLPSLDDFDRAMNSVPEMVEDDSWFEGIVLVQRKLHTILEGLNVEPIEAVGQPFDPQYHEALALKEADGVESGIVIEELLTGYKLEDRIIRPSLVNVAA